MTYFVLADTHSFYNETITALAQAGFDRANNGHAIILCGDAFDRGPGTIELFEFFSELQALGRFVYVRGNHEDLLFECCETLNKGFGARYDQSHHISNGTIDTLAAFTDINRYDLIMGYFDLDAFNKRVAPLLEFCKSSIDFFELPHFVFVHGWAPLCEDWRNGNWMDARWTNGMAANHASGSQGLDGKTVVCGHWHCSWGRSVIDGEGIQFPENDPDQFRTWYSKGIIALDACTSYSGICNCLKI